MKQLQLTVDGMSFFEVINTGRITYKVGFEKETLFQRINPGESCLWRSYGHGTFEGTCFINFNSNLKIKMDNFQLTAFHIVNADGEEMIPEVLKASLFTVTDEKGKTLATGKLDDGGNLQWNPSDFKVNPDTPVTLSYEIEPALSPEEYIKLAIK